MEWASTEELIQNIQDKENLVFADELSRDSYLARSQRTALGDNLGTVQDLWLKMIPKAPILRQAELAQVLPRYFSKDGLLTQYKDNTEIMLSLAAHIIHLDFCHPDLLEPESEIEAEIEKLRTDLKINKHWTQGSWQAAQAAISTKINQEMHLIGFERLSPALLALLQDAPYTWHQIKAKQPIGIVQRGECDDLWEGTISARTEIMAQGKSAEEIVVFTDREVPLRLAEEMFCFWAKADVHKSALWSMFLHLIEKGTLPQNAAYDLDELEQRTWQDSDDLRYLCQLARNLLKKDFEVETIISTAITDILEDICQNLQGPLDVYDFLISIHPPQVRLGMGTMVLSYDQMSFQEDRIFHDPTKTPADNPYLQNPARIDPDLTWENVLRNMQTSGTRWILRENGQEVDSAFWQISNVEPVHFASERKNLSPDKALRTRFNKALKMPPLPQKNRFSVTELEQFISCPYGWFVRYNLKLRGRTTPEAARGAILHQILQKTIQMPDEAQRELYIVAALEEYAAIFPPVTRTIYKQRLMNILKLYGWHSQKRYLEYALQSPGILPSLPDTLITGRADRIDIMQHGILVIDYKNKRTPYTPSDPKKDLQPYLYPLLTKRMLGGEILGGLYISLYHGKHSGSLRDHVKTLAHEGVSEAWEEEKEIAISGATLAVERIKAGDWHEVGKSCPDWCAHHLVERRA